MHPPSSPRQVSMSTQRQCGRLASPRAAVSSVCWREAVARESNSWKRPSTKPKPKFSGCLVRSSTLRRICDAERNARFPQMHFCRKCCPHSSTIAPFPPHTRTVIHTNGNVPFHSLCRLCLRRERVEGWRQQAMNVRADKRMCSRRGSLNPRPAK